MRRQFWLVLETSCLGCLPTEHSFINSREGDWYFSLELVSPEVKVFFDGI